MLASLCSAHLDPDTVRLRAAVHDQSGMILIPDSIIDITIGIVDPVPSRSVLTETSFCPVRLRPCLSST